MEPTTASTDEVRCERIDLRPTQAPPLPLRERWEELALQALLQLHRLGLALTHDGGDFSDCGDCAGSSEGNDAG